MARMRNLTRSRLGSALAALGIAASLGGACGGTGGEASTDVALRLRSFHRDLDTADGRPVVLFTHDAVVSVFLYVLCGWTEQQLDDFLVSLTTLERDGAGWRLDAFADDAHLHDAGLPATAHPGAARVDD